MNEAELMDVNEIESESKSRVKIVNEVETTLYHSEKETYCISLFCKFVVFTVSFLGGIIFYYLFYGPSKPQPQSIRRKFTEPVVGVYITTCGRDMLYMTVTSFDNKSSLEYAAKVIVDDCDKVDPTIYSEMGWDTIRTNTTAWREERIVNANV